MYAAAGNRKAGRPTKEVSDTRGAVMDVFLAGVELQVNNRIDTAVSETVESLESYLEKVKEEFLSHSKKITLITEKRTVDLQGAVHQNFETLLRTITARVNTMIVGPAGTGKTYACAQVAKALGLDFYAQSVGAQTSKSDLQGYMTADGNYISSAFRKAFEFGGIFLMDEIDAGNPNVLITTNSALAGSWCAFPDGMVQKHEDFIFVATANTYGMGANRQYVGRNQIDAATLDRFVTIDWNIDETLESTLVAHSAYGKSWHKVVKAVRKVVENREYRLVVSPRATEKGVALLDAGVDIETVINSTLLAQASKEQRDALNNAAIGAWTEPDVADKPLLTPLETWQAQRAAKVKDLAASIT